MEAGSRNLITNSIVIFLGLVIVFAVLVLASTRVSNPFAQQVMLSTGSAILGSGLTFFLIQMFAVRG